MLATTYCPVQLCTLRTQGADPELATFLRGLRMSAAADGLMVEGADCGGGADLGGLLVTFFERCVLCVSYEWVKM
jgi:hypothetical protein